MPHRLPLSAQIDVEVWAERPADSPYPFSIWALVVRNAGNDIVRTDAANSRILIHQRKDA